MSLVESVVKALIDMLVKIVLFTGKYKSDPGIIDPFLKIESPM